MFLNHCRQQDQLQEIVFPWFLLLTFASSAFQHLLDWMKSICWLLVLFSVFGALIAAFDVRTGTYFLPFNDKQSERSPGFVGCIFWQWGHLQVDFFLYLYLWLYLWETLALFPFVRLIFVGNMISFNVLKNIWRQCLISCLMMSNRIFFPIFILLFWQTVLNVILEYCLTQWLQNRKWITSNSSLIPPLQCSGWISRCVCSARLFAPLDVPSIFFCCR